MLVAALFSFGLDASARVHYCAHEHAYHFGSATLLGCSGIVKSSSHLMLSLSVLLRQILFLSSLGVSLMSVVAQMHAQYAGVTLKILLWCPNNARLGHNAAIMLSAFCMLLTYRKHTIYLVWNSFQVFCAHTTCDYVKLSDSGAKQYCCLIHQTLDCSTVLFSMASTLLALHHALQYIKLVPVVLHYA
jgi:hypothetical protein